MEKIIKEDKPEGLGSKKIVTLIIRYFRLIPPILMIIILGVGYLFLIKPKIDRVRGDVAVGIEERMLEYEKLEQQFDELSELKRAYQKIKQEDIDRINVMLPDKVETEKMLMRMESYIKGEGYILHSLEVTDGSASKKNGKKAKASAGLSVPKDPAPFSALPNEIGVMHIKISLSGLDAGLDSYETYKRFLKVIEGNLKLFDLDRVNFSPGTDNASIELVTYYSKL